MRGRKGEQWKELIKKEPKGGAAVGWLESSGLGDWKAVLVTSVAFIH